MKRFSTRPALAYALAIAIAVLLAYRMVRPMNIFVVGEDFDRPIPVTTAPSGLLSLSATACGVCHSEIYDEWSASVHARAWTDPYFQVDFAFDGSQQVCLNCHTPLQNQQENLVLGFRDPEKFRPILAPNDGFDATLQNEGVTCAVCHVRDGVVIGPYGDTAAPHPTRHDPMMTDGMGACRTCHVVSGKRWDTFYRIPPCGTVAEIREGTDDGIHCTGCHMPAVLRPASDGAIARPGRKHLWKGGHDPDMVRRALRVRVHLETVDNTDKKRVSVALTNVGAAHYLPTGTPDRHLTVEMRLTDSAGRPLKEETHTLRRTILWRPFIIDLWDTRLPRHQPRNFAFTFRPDADSQPVKLEVVVRYHLLGEARRRRIGYENREPIFYTLYRKERQVN